MARVIRIRIDGVKEVQARLARIPREVSRILKSTVEAGAEPIIKRAQALAPTRKGFLKRSIISDFKVDKPFRVELIVGPSRDAFYGFMIEFGTVKMPAQPFLGPAFDDKQGEATRVMVSHFRGAVIRATGAF